MESRSDKRRTQLLDGLTQALAGPDGEASILEVIEKNSLHREHVDSPKTKSTLVYQKKPGYLSPKTRSLLVHEEEIEPVSGLRKLTLIEARKAKIRPWEYVKTKSTSPWNSYDKKYELKIDGFVIVAVQKGPSRKIVTIKTFDQAGSSEKVSMLQRLRHEHFNPPLDIFNFEKVTYIVFDHMPIALAQVVGCPAYPDEVQLAGILRQAKEPG